MNGDFILVTDDMTAATVSLYIWLEIKFFLHNSHCSLMTFPMKKSWLEIYELKIQELQHFKWKYLTDPVQSHGQIKGSDVLFVAYKQILQTGF